MASIDVVHKPMTTVVAVLAESERVVTNGVTGQILCRYTIT